MGGFRIRNTYDFLTPDLLFCHSQSWRISFQSGNDIRRYKRNCAMVCVFRCHELCVWSKIGIFFFFFRFYRLKIGTPNVKKANKEKYQIVCKRVRELNGESEDEWHIYAKLLFMHSEENSQRNFVNVCFFQFTFTLL